MAPMLTDLLFPVTFVFSGDELFVDLEDAVCSLSSPSVNADTNLNTYVVGGTMENAALSRSSAAMFQAALNDLIEGYRKGVFEGCGDLRV